VDRYCRLDKSFIYFVAEMARHEENAKFPSCDAYFDTIQSKKKLPLALQESLTAAFAQIPVASFPDVPSGRGMSFCKINVCIFMAFTCTLVFVNCNPRYSLCSN
jgi:hypothetical protein